jgi:hypothetical protein
MIQRLQTIFIFLAAVITVSMLKTNFAEMAVSSEIYNFSAKGIFKGDEMVFNGLPLMIFIGLVALIHIIVIFLFKKRILQIRILVFTIILLIGLTGLMLYFINAAFDKVSVVYKIPLVLPVVAAILDYLAIRAIGRDEALVRSIDRIR